ncbi:MAG: histidine kinase [Cytophagales bacterium]
MKFRKKPLWLAIPFLSLLIVVFTNYSRVFADRQFFIEKFLICLAVTTSVWMVDVYIFEIISNKYPHFHQTYKRLVLTITSFIVCTFIVYIIDCYIICKIIFNKPLWYNFFENIRITYVVTTIVYVIYECIFFFHNWAKTIKYSEQLKKEHLITQYESLKNQINPHFLFNSLNTLSAIIPQDADKAVDFVQQLSSSYRYLLKMKDKELVMLEDELEFVDSYLFLIKTRYGQNIQIVINRDIQDCKNMLPPVSLQMLIENCIKHNVISKEKPLHIVMNIKEDCIEVQNNLQAKLNTEPSTGLGLENIKKRYSLYSHKEIEVEKTNTHFTVILPLLKIES